MDRMPVRHIHRSIHLNDKSILRRSLDCVKNLGIIKPSDIEHDVPCIECMKGIATYRRYRRYITQVPKQDQLT